MANQDKQRQQSSYMPSSGAQQGGGQTDRPSQGTTGTPQRAPQQGTWLGAPDYSGYGASPFSLMRRLTSDMDRLFENFGFSRSGWPLGLTTGVPSSTLANWSPHIEMFEQDGNLVVEAELPGLRKEDVQAQVEDGAVVISGERRSENRQNEGGRYVSERSYGSFYRAIDLPDGADANNAKATFRDGVLRIEMPVTARQRGRKLDIGEGTTPKS